jgi:CRISPR-associated protein Csx1
VECGERVLGVATWGDPRLWRYAEYVAGGKRVEAFSTLSILREVEKPVKIVVVVLDTLAAAESEGKSQDAIKSYDDIERLARDYASQHLCGIEAEIVVLPGIFERYDRERGGKRLSFESDPRSEFLPLLTYIVFKKALEVDVTSIALDVSHGMNFMPTLALRATEEAAAALAAAKVSQVKVRAYQSDPYPPDFRELARSREDACRPAQGGVKPPSLRYNLILERAFEPWDLTRYISYREQQARKVLTDTRSCDLDGARDLLEKCALPLLGAFRLGALPQLALLAKATPLRELESAIERAVKCWRSKRVVQRGEDGDLKVASGTRFAAGFLALVHARAVLEGAGNLLDHTEGLVPLEKATVTFDELKRLRDLVKGSRVVSELVNREISKLDYLRERWVKLRSCEWARFNELQLGSAPEESKGDESVFKRDFIAHAGFHTDVIEVRLTEKGLEVRVRSDRWELVKKVLREVTQEGAT